MSNLTIKDITWILIILGVFIILILFIIKNTRINKKLDKESRKIEKEILKLLSEKRNKK